MLGQRNIKLAMYKLHLVGYIKYICKVVRFADHLNFADAIFVAFSSRSVMNKDLMASRTDSCVCLSVCPYLRITFKSVIFSFNDASLFGSSYFWLT